MNGVEQFSFDYFIDGTHVTGKMRMRSSRLRPSEMRLDVSEFEVEVMTYWHPYDDAFRLSTVSH